MKNILLGILILSSISCREEPKKIIVALASPVNSGEANVVSAPIKPQEVKLIKLFSYTTKFKIKPNRVQNIKLAAEKINGFFLKPKQVFSFNEIVGPRTFEKGYLPAPTYVAGIIQNDIGGGICQVSSTLYSTVMHIDLTILERRPHSRVSSYIPSGLDATVNYPKSCWGKKKDLRICYDLKFRNDYNFPITFKTELVEDKLIISAFSIKNIPATITSKWVLNGTPPFKKVVRKLKWQKKKKLMQKGKYGKTGFRVFTFSFKDRVEKRKIYSRYNPVNEIWYAPKDMKVKKDE